MRISRHDISPISVPGGRTTMSALLATHLVFAGIWLGCVLTEALFERALLGKGHEQELILVELHKRVDLTIEVPAFVVVLATGAVMLASAPATGLLYVKIGLGLVAIAANIYCVWLVFRRATAARTGHWEQFTALDHQQHRYGTVVLAGMVLPLALGIYLLGL